MNLEQINQRLALKDLVDTFSNLADEKRVHEQTFLFTEDAQVTTYIGGELFADLKGRAQIEEVFSTFLAQFHTVYHINGQHSVTINGNQAEGINYCQVTLVGEKEGKNILTQHGVRYQDSYTLESGQWLIAKRVANFMYSDSHEVGA